MNKKKQNKGSMFLRIRDTTGNFYCKKSDLKEKAKKQRKTKSNDRPKT